MGLNLTRVYYQQRDTWGEFCSDNIRHNWISNLVWRPDTRCHPQILTFCLDIGSWLYLGVWDTGSDFCYELLSGITLLPVKLYHRFYRQFAVPGRLSPTGLSMCGSSIWCWDPFIHCGLCDGCGFIMVDLLKYSYPPWRWQPMIWWLITWSEAGAPLNIGVFGEVVPIDILKQGERALSYRWADACTFSLMWMYVMVGYTWYCIERHLLMLGGGLPSDLEIDVAIDF